MNATEDAAGRSVIAAQGPGEYCRSRHLLGLVAAWLVGLGFGNSLSLIGLGLRARLELLWLGGSFGLGRSFGLAFSLGLRAGPELGRLLGLIREHLL
jgi:hypothetical protein